MIIFPRTVNGSSLKFKRVYYTHCIQCISDSSQSAEHWRLLCDPYPFTIGSLVEDQNNLQTGQTTGLVNTWWSGLALTSPCWFHIVLIVKKWKAKSSSVPAKSSDECGDFTQTNLLDVSMNKIKTLLMQVAIRPRWSVCAGCVLAQQTDAKWMLIYYHIVAASSGESRFETRVHLQKAAEIDQTSATSSAVKRYQVLQDRWNGCESKMTKNELFATFQSFSYLTAFMPKRPMPG